MNRFILPVLAISLLVPALAHSQDTITYRNRKTGVKEEMKGVIQSESIQGIKIKPFKSPGTEQLIPAMDIIEVEYKAPSNLTGPQMHHPIFIEGDIFKAAKADRPDKIKETIKSYRDVIAKLETMENAQAYMEYRLALLQVRLVELEPDRADDARNALVSFKEKYPKSWEYAGVMQILARIQESQGKLDDARSTFEELAGRSELPPELRGQANFALVRMLLRAGQIARAETRVQELELDKTIKDGPDALQLQVYKIELQVKKDEPGDAEKQLKAILAGQTEDVKAHAANVLADFYMRDKRPEDAFWQYLWVDVLYNKDPEEHARALFHLIKLFKDVRNDEARAQKLHDKLREPEFAGSEYQRMAAALDKAK